MDLTLNLGSGFEVVRGAYHSKTQKVTGCILG